MQKLVIYPGRFHPFHRGHKSVFDLLGKTYGSENVYIASSNSQAPMTSPFSFEEKRKMMTVLGVPEDRIVQVKNPYQAQEITKDFDAGNTVLIFAISEKDVDRFSFRKKDGSLGYMQPMPANEAHMAPMSEHAYVMLAPTITFRVAGKSVDSASKIRELYINSDDKTRKQILIDLYGQLDKEIKEIFDRKLGITERLSNMMVNLKESIENTRDKNYRALELALKMEEEVQAIEEADLKHAFLINEPDGHLIAPGGGQGTYDVKSLQTRTNTALQGVAKMIEMGGFANAYYALYENSALEYKLRALKLYEDFMKKQGRRPLAMNREVDLGEAEDIDETHDTSSDYVEEAWSEKYKNSINCDNPKGFSQRAHCQGRKKK